MKAEAAKFRVNSDFGGMRARASTPFAGTAALWMNG
jgi:hypothetical protein